MSSNTTTGDIVAGNFKEFSHSTIAVLIVWTIGIILLFLASIIKFIRGRQGGVNLMINLVLIDKQEVPTTVQFLEDIMENFFPLLGITFLNIITFGCYIYCVFATYFAIFLYIILSVVEDKFPEKHRALIKLLVPGFWIVSLYFNFWINDETRV